MDNQLRVVEELIESPSWKWLGIQLESYQSGLVRLSFSIQPQFLQSYHYLQGGLMFTLLDACGAAAVCPLADPKKAVTLEAKINYLRPVSEGKVFAEGEVVHEGKTTMITMLRAFDSNERNLALATATFAVI